MSKTKSAFKEGCVVVGPFMKISSLALVEVFGHEGFDFVIIDTEHGPMSIETAENLIQAAQLVGITTNISVREIIQPQSYEWLKESKFP